MSQATPTKFSMLFKHTYSKLFWKFGDHSFNFSLVHGPSWSRVLEAINRYGVGLEGQFVNFYFLKIFLKRSLWGHAWCHKKYTLLTFKGICMNFLLELKFFILSHPVTSKQPHKIVQIHMRRPAVDQGVDLIINYRKSSIRSRPLIQVYLY